MPRIAILGAYRVLPVSIDYTPKAGCPVRSVVVSRSEHVLGTTKIKPIILRDEGFWPTDKYEEAVAAIAGAGYGAWSTPANAWDRVDGGVGIKKVLWESLKTGTWKDTEMVACMIARIARGDNQADYFVSAAPNMLHKPLAVGYASHTKGDNKGTQIHAEMSMAEQLNAVIEKICSIQETPTGIGSMQRRGPAREALTVEADLFIEKGEMCDGCQGTWSARIGDGKFRI